MAPTNSKEKTLFEEIPLSITPANVADLLPLKPGAAPLFKGVFIDSYEGRKIDVSDLKKLGKASTALQGAAIGHFLNEVQEPGGFEAAHNASLLVDGKIFGELAGDASIITKSVLSGGISEGVESTIFEYNANNRFELKQGIETVEKGTGQFLPNGIEIKAGEIKRSGELQGVNKIK